MSKERIGQGLRETDPKVAGDYRLLFATGPADTLHIIDIILRRDLDRWLSAGG